MKTLVTLILFTGILFPSVGQVVTNVNWALEGKEQIVITYDLAKQDNVIYFDVSVKVKIDKETITPTALSGDVGNYIKVGTNKKIVWNMFQDIQELNGELSVEVLAFNPVPTAVTDAKPGKKPDVPVMPQPAAPTKNIPFWIGIGGIGVTGIGLLTSGMKNTSEGLDLYKIYENNTVETAAIYTEMSSTREEIYKEANKKYKTGTITKVGGGIVLLAAGVIMVNRIIQMKKINKQALSVAPFINVDRGNASGKIGAQGGVTLTYRLH